MKGIRAAAGSDCRPDHWQGKHVTRAPEDAMRSARQRPSPSKRTVGMRSCASVHSGRRRWSDATWQGRITPQLRTASAHTEVGRAGAHPYRIFGGGTFALKGVAHRTAWTMRHKSTLPFSETTGAFPWSLGNTHLSSCLRHSYPVSAMSADKKGRNPTRITAL
jgi:hypothetical protein